MLQGLTTREPDREQLAVAIAALEAVLGGRESGPTRAQRTGRDRGLSPSLDHLSLGTVIERLVEQIEGGLPSWSARCLTLAVIADQDRYAEVGREYRRLEDARALAAE